MSLLVGMGVFALVVASGASVLGLLDPGRRLDRTAKVPAGASAMKMEVSLVGFGVLEIDGDDLPWPSEAGRDVGKFNPLPWPSSGWDDPHFGRMNVEGAFMEELDRKRNEDRDHHAVELEDDRQASRNQQRLQQLREKAAQTTQKVASRVKQEVQGVKEQAEEQFFGAVAEKRQQATQQLGFDPAEVPRMVREMGLAGAVEHIRGITGWDFKKAAQFVAKALRS